MVCNALGSYARAQDVLLQNYIILFEVHKLIKKTQMNRKYVHIYRDLWPPSSVFWKLFFRTVCNAENMIIINKNPVINVYKLKIFLEEIIKNSNEMLKIVICSAFTVQTIKYHQKTLFGKKKKLLCLRYILSS